MLALAWLGAALALGWVVAYYLYAWWGVAGLASWLTRPRRVGFAVALALAIPALVSVGGPYGGAGPRGWPMVVVLLSLGWAYTRQWLWLEPAAVTETLSPASEREWPSGSPVAVLPGGDAVLLAVLARRRLLRAGELVVAHCALARSTAVFRTGERLRPTLPLAAGFELGAGGRRWDAVDGHGCDGGSSLARAPVALCTLGAWRERFPAARLHGDAEARVSHATLAPVPRTRAARGVPNATELGLVRGALWQPLAAGDLDSCPEWAGAAAGEALYVARWAATARGWV